MRAVSRLEDYTYVDRKEDNCISRVYSCATLEISYLTNSFSKVRFDLIVALGGIIYLIKSRENERVNALIMSRFLNTFMCAFSHLSL